MDQENEQAPSIDSSCDKEITASLHESTTAATVETTTAVAETTTTAAAEITSVTVAEETKTTAAADIKSATVAEETKTTATAEITSATVAEETKTTAAAEIASETVAEETKTTAPAETTSAIVAEGTKTTTAAEERTTVAEEATITTLTTAAQETITTIDAEERTTVEAVATTAAVETTSATDAEGTKTTTAVEERTTIVEAVATTAAEENTTTVAEVATTAAAAETTILTAAQDTITTIAVEERTATVEAVATTAAAELETATVTTSEENIQIASHEEKSEEPNLNNEKDSNDDTEKSNSRNNVDSSENKSDTASQSVIENVDEPSSTEKQMTDELPESCCSKQIEEQSCVIQDNDVSHTSQEKLENSVTTVSANDDPEIIVENVDTNSEKQMEVDCDKPSSSNEIDDDIITIMDTISLKKTSEIEAQPLQPSENEKSGDTSVMEIDLDSQDKEESTEKNTEEPEKTEFIQISQDKTDDSQIEGQSMDAEDPFGGDNLAADTVETLDNDNFQVEDINFRKLDDQPENLQDVFKAKDSTSDPPPSERNEVSEENHDNDDDIEFISEIPKESTDDVSNDSVGNKTSDDTRTNTNETTTPSVSESPKSDEKETDSDKAKKTDGDEQAHETTEEQSTVLPGQDDELCIIPDNLKVVVAEKPTETTSDVNASKDNNDTPQEAKDHNESPSIEPAEKQIVETSSSNEVVITEDKNLDEHDNIQSVSTEPSSSSAAADNVIDLADESKVIELEEITPETCAQCNSKQTCKIKVKVGTENFNVCSENCQTLFTTAHQRATDIPSDGVNSKYEKRCANCLLIVESGDDRNLSWETMEFCNEECLGKFQTKYGSYCRNCNGSVASMCLGKYCVRFGYDVRQFCCSSCLEEFKKGLKVCSYCQKDISSGTDGFLAPVGDKGQFKDFCTQFCMEKYSRMNSTEPPRAEKKACKVCQEEKIVHCEVQVDNSEPVAICSEPCFAAFKFVNQVDPDQCSTCKKYFGQLSKKSTVVFHNKEAHTFCNKTCLNIFIITHRKIVPCNWCKVKKYNFDMIMKEFKTGQMITMCSLNCLTLYQVSINAVSARRVNCDFCKEISQAQYHLTMSDATIRNFCCYECVMKFQSQYTKSPITIPSDDSAPVPTGTPKRNIHGKLPTQATTKKIMDIQSLSSLSNVQSKKTMPVISSVTSLASNGPTGTMTQKSTSTVAVGVNNATITNSTAPSSQSPIVYKQQVIIRPPSPVKIHNKMTQCKPLMHTKGVSVKPHPCTKSTQTDEVQKVIIPIPVPIYVPFPIHMWSFPFPVPMPFPLPIPVPIFIPTTRNTTKGILKEIKRIQEKMPTDPFEAELLMMAEMVATDKKTDSDSDSSEENNAETETADSGNAFGDDMLQMALKMATGEIEEPAVDLETALTPNTISATQPPTPTEATTETVDVQPERTVVMRGKKRVVSQKSRGGPTKRGRRTGTSDEPLMPPPEPQPPTIQPQIIEPIEKPDANMALKYTFGVNAWRKWVVTKNTELEKENPPSKKVKFFKTDLLQLTADELNYSLCLFVKEVRKPNGSEYAPDTIYYLCLGIQQYLFENNRIDNIFTDTYYEQFTDCLNDVAKKFSVLYNDAQYIVTRVEEEHLWECKQLGAHSPHVLLSTLMFFNTKHFNLVTVEEHMQLSFSHIMKHWKRNPAAQAAAVAGKAPGSRNVLLRFYPPQSALEANSKKKKVYEQQENEDNPLRCPVKLYEFYLSKCPESVKTRNDVFYLLPERSCVPDSPVWYSTSPLAKENLVKMLHRVKMVKEINIALLSS